VPVVFSGDTLSLFFNGRQQTVHASHPSFDAIRTLVADGGDVDVIHLQLLVDTPMRRVTRQARRGRQSSRRSSRPM
jgi:hypothetical protein